MFGIGTMELFVILLVGVLVLGPEHLPKIMRSLTKVMSDVRRVSTDFQRTINLEANKEEWEQKQTETSAAKKKKKKKPPPDPKPEAAEQESTLADAPPADTPEQEMPTENEASDAASGPDELTDHARGDRI